MCQALQSPRFCRLSPDASATDHRLSFLLLYGDPTPPLSRVGRKSTAIKQKKRTLRFGKQKKPIMRMRLRTILRVRLKMNIKIKMFLILRVRLGMARKGICNYTRARARICGRAPHARDVPCRPSNRPDRKQKNIDSHRTIPSGDQAKHFSDTSGEHSPAALREATRHGKTTEFTSNPKSAQHNRLSP